LFLFQLDTLLFFLFTFTILQFSLHVSDRLVHHQENQFTRAASGTFPYEVGKETKYLKMMHRQPNIKMIINNYNFSTAQYSSSLMMAVKNRNMQQHLSCKF